MIPMHICREGIFKFFRLSCNPSEALPASESHRSRQASSVRPSLSDCTLRIEGSETPSQPHYTIRPTGSSPASTARIFSAASFDTRIADSNVVGA